MLTMSIILGISIILNARFIFKITYWKDAYYAFAQDVMKKNSEAEGVVNESTTTAN